MKHVVLLDAGPLGLLTFSKAKPLASTCNEWLQSLLMAGIEVTVPEISDYEVRRELLRAGLVRGIRRLDALIATPGIVYAPLTTAIIRRAAVLWTEARRAGRPLSDPQALDCDVILAAQAQLEDVDGAEVTVATTNVRHLSLFVDAVEWQDMSIEVPSDTG